MTGTAAQEPRLLLVIEDEDLGEAFLSHEGYAAFVATSVEDALALVTTQTFDLILTGFLSTPLPEAIAWDWLLLQKTTLQQVSPGWLVHRFSLVRGHGIAEAVWSITVPDAL